MCASGRFPFRAAGGSALFHAFMNHEVLMRRVVPFLLAVVCGWTTAASAQVPDWVTQVLKAAQLPVTAAEARTEGVADTTVRTVLEAMRTANVPAADAKDMLDTARAVNREHGPVDNFGAFVQSKLQAGLRGRELAAAIRAEHVARGKGHAKGADKVRGEKGKPDDAGRAKAGGDKDDRARGKAPATKGRPDKPTR